MVGHARRDPLRWLRQALRVAVDLDLDHHQVAVACLNARVDADRVTRVQAKAGQRLVAHPEGVTPAGQLRVPAERPGARHDGD